MPQWIDTTTDEHLRTWVRHCPAMKLVTTIDGRILWANMAFCEWVKYRLDELLRMTWKDLSVNDEALAADIDEASRLSPYNPVYVIRKRYIPQGDVGQWGYLTVMRYPLSGEIECCLCTWEPVKNGAVTAFSLAMEHSEKLEHKMTELTAEIRKVTTRSEEEDWVLATIRIARRYPKRAAFTAIMTALTALITALVVVLKSLGFIPTQVKIEKVDYDWILEHDHIEGSVVGANGIAYAKPDRTIEGTTAGGVTVSWSATDRASRHIVLHGKTGRDKRRSGFRFGDSTVSDGGGSIDTLRGIAESRGYRY